LYLANLLLPREGEHFSGGMLWIRERGVWSEIAERVGDCVVAKFRAVVGDNRGLDEAPAQLFEPSELVEAQSCLAQPMLIGWDAFFVPETPTYFVFVSHDGPVCMIAKSPEEQTRLTELAADWKPQIRQDYYFR